MELTGGCVISSLAEHTHKRCHKSAGAPCPCRIPISQPPEGGRHFSLFLSFIFLFWCARRRHTTHPRNFFFDNMHCSHSAPAVNWNAIFRQQDSQYRTPGLITFLSWVMPLLNFLFPQRRRRQPIFANNIKLDAALRVGARPLYICVRASGADFYRIAATAVYK